MDAKLNYLAYIFAKQLIMRTPKIKFFYFASTALAFGLLLTNCVGYQNATYYPSDGIYGDPVVVVQKTENGNGKYYKQYFQNMGDNYSSVPDDAVYFTDPDSYANPNVAPNQPAQQIPWGGQTTSTDVYIFNNQPTFGFGFSNFGWGFNNFNFGYDPFFYGYNPYRFGFRNRFYNPWWNGFSPFYDPFYSRFYSPFYYGFAGLHYRPPFYRDNYNNRFNRNNRRGNYSPYAGVSNGRRGEKGYRNSRSANNRNQRAQNGQQKNNEFATRAAINRLNIGRSSMYLNTVPYVAKESAETTLTRGTSNGAIRMAPSNGRNLQQYGVQRKATSASQPNTLGRRFTPSRYTNTSALKNVRSSNRVAPVRQQNYSTPSKQYNYSTRNNSSSSVRSSAPSRSSSSYRGGSSVNRGRSSGRRN